MTRPYADPWVRGEQLTAFDPDLARRRVSGERVCEVKVDGIYCRRLSVSAFVLPGMAADLPGSYRSTCPTHAEADAPRWCVRCTRRNRSGDPYVLPGWRGDLGHRATEGRPMIDHPMPGPLELPPAGVTCMSCDAPAGSDPWRHQPDDTWRCTGPLCRHMAAGLWAAYDVDIAYDLAVGKPVQQVPTAALHWTRADYLEPERMSNQRLNESEPLLIAVRELLSLTVLLLLDGRHRLARAIEAGRESISARVLTSDEAAQCRIPSVLGMVW